MRRYRWIIDPASEQLLRRTHGKKGRSYRLRIRHAFRGGAFRHLFERFAECNRRLTLRALSRKLGISAGELSRILRFKSQANCGVLAQLIFSDGIDRRRLGKSLTRDSNRRMRAACFSRAVEIAAHLLGEVPADANREAVVLEDDAALLLSAIELLPLEQLRRESVRKGVSDEALLKKIVDRSCRYTPRAAGTPEVAFHPNAAEYLDQLMSRYGHAALVAYVALQDMWTTSA